MLRRSCHHDPSDSSTSYGSIITELDSLSKQIICISYVMAPGSEKSLKTCEEDLVPSLQ